MKDKIIKNKKIIIVVFSILIFLLILRDVYYYEITKYDNWAYNVFVESLRSENMTTIMKMITFLGSGEFLITSILLLFIFLKDKKESFLALINLCFIFLLNNIVKIIVQRPRPSGYNIIVESNYSFPSGHSMVSTAFYGFLIYLVYKKIKNKKIKYGLITVLFLIIISICISRVYLGVHYLSDTLAGFFLTIAYLMIFVTYIPKVLERFKYESKKKKIKN